MKIGDKVEVKRKSEFGGEWYSIGKGYVTNVYHNGIGELNFVGFKDKEWADNAVGETIPVNSLKMKVVKI